MDFVPVIVSGIASGSAYALLALGIVIIFRSTDTVHFAIGDTGALMVYLAATAIGAGMPMAFALIMAMVMGGLFGVVTQRLLIAPLGHRRNIVFIALVVTIGLGLLMRALIGAVWGHQAIAFAPLIAGHVQIAGVAIAWNKLFATGVALVAMAVVGWFFSRTALGAAMRASAADEFAARLIGLNAAQIAFLAWFLGCALSTLAMFFLAADSSLTPNVATHPLFRAFAGVFLGGLTSMPGAVAGGFAIGVLDNIAGRYVSANFRDTLVFGVIVTILFIRPSGFLGLRQAVRV
ncbi:MAG TPA: branched-chain amino acid ABC transporter permease [Ramlibacter sp.]|nr:branched-chain amino acid ABC transporter permease [Ramlibacter sp.]